MPKCEVCNDTRIVYVVDANPPYRPCPKCTPLNVDVKKEIEEKRQRDEHYARLNIQKEAEIKERIKHRANIITGLLSSISLVFLFGELIFDKGQNLEKPFIFMGVCIVVGILIGIYMRIRYKIWIWELLLRSLNK